MARPDLSPRSPAEYAIAVKAQARHYRRWRRVALVGFVISAVIGGFGVETALEATRKAERTAAVVARQAADFRRLNVSNDLRACVRANDARRGVRVNSEVLASLVTASLVGLPDPPATNFRRNRTRLAANIKRNQPVECARVVEGIDLLSEDEVLGIVDSRGRARINPPIERP